VNRSNEGRLAEEERGREGAGGRASGRRIPRRAEGGISRPAVPCPPHAFSLCPPFFLAFSLSVARQRFFSNLQPKRSGLQDGRRTARREREGSQPVGEILQHPIHSTEQERERGGREGGRKVEG